jgi:hypothetical protein
VRKKRKRSKKAVAASILTHPDVIMAAIIGLAFLDGKRRDDLGESLAASMLGLFYTAFRPAVLYHRHLSRGN